MTDEPREDEPASIRCACHGKTEAELAMPYAAFSFGLPLAMIVVALLAWWLL